LPPGSLLRVRKQYHGIPGTYKSLDTYSLALTRGGGQQVASNGRNQGLNGRLGPANGSLPDLQIGFIPSANSVGFFTWKAVRFQIYAENLLFVENGTEHGNGEVREIGRPFIELQPPHHAVVCKILRNARFRNSQMLREARLDGIGATAVAPAD